MNELRAYLYTINEDHTLNIHEGYVSPKVHTWSRQRRFTPDRGSWFDVSSEPGEMYYRKLWLIERDDELATRLYVEYHERKIKEAERALEMHKQAIATLKGELTL